MTYSNSKGFLIAFMSLMIAAVLPMSMHGCKSCDRSQETPKMETPSSPEMKSFFFECNDGMNVVISYTDHDTMSLFLPDKTLELDHLISGSGARYGKGDVIFWSKGSNAMLEIGDRKIGCKENRKKSIIEDAKLRGFDFWAAGNEPGWKLEIGPEKTVFVADYGQYRYEFKTPKPEVNEKQRMTTYRMSDKDNKLDVVLRGVECTDSMSGDKFETSVLVVFDGKPLPGCGKALH